MEINEQQSTLPQGENDVAAVLVPEIRVVTGGINGSRLASERFDDEV